MPRRAHREGLGRWQLPGDVWGRALGGLHGRRGRGAGRGGAMRPVVVALGNFDGVHLGHQEVLRRAVEEGRRRRMKVVAATFHPHPRTVLGAGDPPKLLTPLELRCEMLLSYGADEVWVIPFDVALSRKTPEQFVKDVLIGEGGAGWNGGRRSGTRWGHGGWDHLHPHTGSGLRWRSGRGRRPPWTSLRAQGRGSGRRQARQVDRLPDSQRAAR